jgi:hypothetical protein
VTTGPAPAATRQSAVRRLMGAAILVLAVDNVVGGLAGIAAGVTTSAQAFGTDAKLSAPWPFLLVQTAVGLLAWRTRGWVRIISSGLLAAMCAESVLVMAFGDDFAAPTLPGGAVAGQVGLAVLTLVVGVVAALNLHAGVRDRRDRT